MILLMHQITCVGNRMLRHYWLDVVCKVPGTNVTRQAWLLDAPLRMNTYTHTSLISVRDR